MKSALDNIGVLRLADRLSHSPTAQLVSIACFILAAVVRMPLVVQALPVAWAKAVYHLALATTLTLSGIPNAAQFLCTAASGQVDTHVLM